MTGPGKCLTLQIARCDKHSNQRETEDGITEEQRHIARTYAFVRKWMATADARSLQGDFPWLHPARY
jgi:hypothetical protein